MYLNRDKAFKISNSKEFNKMLDCFDKLATTFFAFGYRRPERSVGIQAKLI